MFHCIARAALACVLLLATAAHAGTGHDWLMGQASADGAFINADAIAAPLQATSEALRALHALGEPAPRAALAFVNGAPKAHTEYLARAIIVNVQAGHDVSAWTAELGRRQNTDGGFGDRAGHASAVLDTAFALEALALAQTPPSGLRGRAVEFLLDGQQEVGAWSDGANASSPYLTALAMRALWHHRHLFAGVTDALVAARSYLLSVRGADGLWGESFEASLALIAILPTLQELSQVAESVAALRAVQRADGSWDGAVYTTALALRALQLAQQPQPNPDLVTLSGRVVDGQTRLPLAGVRITVEGAGAVVLTTGTDGRFVATGLPAGSYALRLTLDDYAPLAARTSAGLGQTVEFGTLQLLPGAGATTGTVRGTVTAAFTGTPLAGVAVSVSGSSAVAVSAADGTYQLTGVSAGAVNVQASLAGYGTASGTGALAAGGVLLFSPVLAPGDPMATVITGRVTDGVTGSPLAGATVVLDGANVVRLLTDADGRYAVDGLSAGSTDIAVAADGYTPVDTTVTVAAGSTLVFAPRLYAVPPPNANAPAVTGAVVDAATGAPLANVQVSVVVGGGVEELLTEFSGRFLTSGLAGESVELHFTQDGYVPMEYTLSLQPARTLDIGQIRLRGDQVQALLPDLVAVTVESGATVTDPNSLTLSGELIVTIENHGHAPSQGNVAVTLFHDADGNGVLDRSEDILVGGGLVDRVMAVGERTVLHVPVGARLPFRDAPVTVWVDSGQSVIEVDETNNVAVGRCNRSCLQLDDFDDGAADGWTAIPNSLGNVGTWAADAGTYAVEGGGAWYGDTGWTNYSVETRVQFPAGATAAAGLLFRLRDADNWYRLALEDGRAYLSARIEGTDSGALAEAPVAVAAGRWYTLRVEVLGNVIRASVDGAHVLDYVGVVLDHGAIGLMDDGVAVRYDDVRVNRCVDCTLLTDDFADGNVADWQLYPNRQPLLPAAGVLVSPDTRANGMLVGDSRWENYTVEAKVRLLGEPSSSTVAALVFGFTAQDDHLRLQLSHRPTLFINEPGNARQLEPVEPIRIESYRWYHLRATIVDGTIKGYVDGRLLFQDMSVQGRSGVIGFSSSGIRAEFDDLRVSCVDRNREFMVVEKWRWSGGLTEPASNQVLGAPVVAPLFDTSGDGSVDGSDEPAVIFSSYEADTESDGLLRAVRGRDGSELWTVTDPAHRTVPAGSLAVGDIDNDGHVEIIAGRSGGGLIAFEHTGAFKWQTADAVRWRWSGPAIADLDADGMPEIVIGRRVYNADGRLRWVGNGFGGESAVGSGSLSIVADIDLDGTPEVIAGAAAYAATGERLWQTDAAGDGFTAVGNFDADRYPEIVVVYRGRISLLNHDGSFIWGPLIIPGFPQENGGAPTVADLDGDGVPEIAVAGKGEYTAFRADGSVLWTAPIRDGSSESTGSSVFDFDDDGRAEVVYADEEHLWVYRGHDGNPLTIIPHNSTTVFELPVVADIDNDGRADIVVVENTSRDGFRGLRAFQALANNWADTRSIWNQHSYHITNINDDGSVPVMEQASWQTQNSYRLNTFADHVAPSEADLTASLLTVIDNGAGQSASLAVRVGNAGIESAATATVAFYTEHPRAGGVRLGTVNAGTLAAGAYRDVTFDGVVLAGDETLYAMVDPDDALRECREGNNLVAQPVSAATALGSLAVVTDASAYAPSSPVEFTGVVTNTGALPAEYVIELRIEDASGTPVTSFTPQSVGVLASGGTAAVTASWDTGTVIAGRYDVRGVLRAADGAVITESVYPFEITHPDTEGAAFTLRTSADKPVYHTSDTVQISALIVNRTLTTLAGAAELQLGVTSAAGQTVFDARVPLGDIVPGGFREATTPYAFATIAPGMYSISAVVVDNAGLTLATGQTQYEVQENRAWSLTGQTALASSILDVGDTQVCTDSVTNVGGVEITGQGLRQAVVNATSQTPITAELVEITLAPGSRLALTRSISTVGLVAGHYACVLQAEVAGVWETLAYAVFTILASPNEPPIADAGPDQTVKVGQVATLDGAGSTDPDGDSLAYMWTIVEEPVGAVAVLSDPTAVNPGFLADARGMFIVELVVTDGLAASVSDSVAVTVANTAPVANAGDDQPVVVGDVVTLDGSASTDADGDGLTYRWRVVDAPDGSASALSDATAVMPIFIVDSHGRYEFELIVNDGMDDSEPDSVTVNVGNVSPLANAGPDQLVYVGDTATLDGAASSDADGDALDYRWRIISAPDDSWTTISDPTAVVSTLVIDAHGDYIAELVVNDGRARSDPDAVVLSVLNVPPVADAGPDQAVIVGDVVTLDGTGSADADGSPLTYTWHVLSKPPGSNAVLAGPGTRAPTLLIDVGGLYVVQLVVNDGFEASAADTVVLDVVNVRPEADAGADRGVAVGDVVTLDGTGSHDADGDALAYHWSFARIPDGSSAVFGDPAASSPTFVADMEGLYVAQLSVHDGELASAAATATVVASMQNTAPDCAQARAVPDTLWPPNHRLVPVSIEGVSDGDNDPVLVTVAAVTQDEPVNATGDGDTSPDAIISGPGAYLRAERTGHGNGRVYALYFEATDGRGGRCAGRVTAGVPHSNGVEASGVDDGQLYDATGP